MRGGDGNPEIPGGERLCKEYRLPGIDRFQLIGAGGLGLTVYTGLGRLNVGGATAGGVGIVLLAIILDRITQALGEQNGVRTPSLRQTLASFFRPRASVAGEAGNTGS